MNLEKLPDAEPITSPNHIPSTPTYGPQPLGMTHLVMREERSISGPIPSSAEMTGYKELQADLPDRIMRMAEQNALSERKQAERSQIFQLIDSLGRRTIALLAFSGAIYASYLLTMSNHDWAGATLGGGALVAVIASFIKKDGDDPSSTKK